MLLKQHRETACASALGDKPARNFGAVEETGYWPRRSGSVNEKAHAGEALRVAHDCAASFWRDFLHARRFAVELVGAKLAGG